MAELRTANFRRHPFGSDIELMCTDGLGNMYILRYNDHYEIMQFLTQGLKLVSEDIKRNRDANEAAEEVPQP